MTVLDAATVAALAAASGLSAADVRYWVPRLPPQASAPEERLARLQAIAALRPPEEWSRAHREVATIGGDIEYHTGRSGRIVHRRRIACARCGERAIHAGRGLCGRCHRQETAAGTIGAWPRAARPTEKGEGDDCGHDGDDGDAGGGDRGDGGGAAGALPAAR